MRIQIMMKGTVVVQLLLLLVPHAVVVHANDTAVYDGKATYYGGNPSGGACGYNDLPESSFPFGMSAAVGDDTFDDGYGCGACYEITCEGPYSTNPSCLCDGTTPTVVVQVTDQCPECATTHFDLNPAAMELVVGDGLAGTCGVIATQYRRVSCSFDTNIKIRSKSGTSEWWYGLHVDDVAGYGAISSVKMREQDSSTFDIVCDKSQGASFWVCSIPSVPLVAPLDVELTDSAGRVLVSSSLITHFGGNAEFDFGSNFEEFDSPSTTNSPIVSPSPTPTPITSAPTKLPAPTTDNNSEKATTTRYWDCSGGACGCAYLPPFLGGDHNKPAHCYSNGLFPAPDGNAHGALFYGAAAVSTALGGGWWLAEGCGKCYKLTGTSNIPGHDSTSVTTLVLKATNYCPPSNSACSGDKKHFDIAAPGFDWAGASQSNTCSEREPENAAGFASCGNWMIASSNPNENCDCDLFVDSVLRDGCHNFKSLYWNNPQVDFEEVDCPDELAQLPCWEENGNTYSWPDAADLCMDPLHNSSPTGGGGSSPTMPPAAQPTEAPTKSPAVVTPAPISTTSPPTYLRSTPAPTKNEAPPTTTPTPKNTNAPSVQEEDGDDACCSHNHKDCIANGAWCNDISRCGVDSSCLDHIWLSNGALTSCIKRWQGTCTVDDDCCPGLSCDTTSNPWWHSCQYSAPSTEAPVVVVTNAPVAPPPTQAPTVGGGDSSTGGDSPPCCSHDHKYCLSDGAWCNDIDRCGVDQSCLDYAWLEHGSLGDDSCIKRWTGVCHDDSDCCPGLYCDTTTNPHWQSCQYAPL